MCASTTSDGSGISHANACPLGIVERRAAPTWPGAAGPQPRPPTSAPSTAGSDRDQRDAQRPPDRVAHRRRWSPCRPTAPPRRMAQPPAGTRSSSISTVTSRRRTPSASGAAAPRGPQTRPCRTSPSSPARPPRASRRPGNRSGTMYPSHAAGRKTVASPTRQHAMTRLPRGHHRLPQRRCACSAGTISS